MLTYQTEMTIPLSHLKAELVHYSELIKHGAISFRRGFYFYLEAVSYQETTCIMHVDTGNEVICYMDAYFLPLGLGSIKSMIKIMYLQINIFFFLF